MGVVVLIRHTQLASHWNGRCYGRSNAGLSREGSLAARGIARALDFGNVSMIATSPSRRARFLGALIARQYGIGVHLDSRLAEFNFGSWEGESWDAIYAHSGSAMMGLITQPATFRIDGGETTFELRDRAMAWFDALPRDNGTIIAVTHGGPIAAIRGSLSGASVQDWPSLVPDYGERVEISR